MRNGNPVTLGVDLGSKHSSYPTYEEWKLGILQKNSIERYSSYPTYEEWKLLFNIFIYCIHIYSSYPTYEEWKPPSYRVAILKKDGSYPTYEEWKQR